MAVRYVEWIKSDGKSHFDLGIKPDQTTRVVCEFEYTDGLYIFSSCQSWKNKNFSVYSSGAAYNTTSVAFTALSKNTKHTIDFDKNVLKIDGSVKNTFSASTFTSDYSLYLFADNYGGKAQEFITATAYTCKVYKNDVLVGDFRPCIDDNGTPALYDEVSKAYINGVGTFTAGPELAVPAVDFGTVCRMPLRIGGAEKIDYADNFADNDWATIAKVCAAGLMPDSWKDDGTSYKDMPIGGNAYRVVIVGKGHDEFEDGKKAPFTFQLYNSYKTTYAMNSSNTNAGGWAQTALRNKHLPIILAAMPSEVQTAIKPVKKLTSAGYTGTNVVATLDKLFVPSEIEVFGHYNNSIAGEGTQYEYYKKGGSKTKTANGNANSWQERSPSKSSINVFCCVGSTGSATTGSAGAARGVSPMFCFGNNLNASEDKTYTVTLSGNLTSTQGYVMIDGTTYSSAQTITVKKGAALTVWRSTGSSNTAYITLNGTEVVRNIDTVSYTYTVNSNCSINFGQSGNPAVYYANITTE